MTTTVGIVGYVEETRRFLESHLQRPDLRLVNIISREEIMIHGPDYPFEERLETGLNRLRESGATAVITYWDFPANLLTAFIANRAGLPYASIEAVMKCEHKYWFRRVQTRVAHAPEFCAFHPFRDDPWTEITLKYPFWVKPVVGHSSMLGFEVKNDEDFEQALSEIRDGVEDLTRPFHYALDHTEMPEDLRDLGSTLCVAEEIISEGRQYTLEGYVRGGETVVYGIVESLRDRNGHTFSRYQYPAQIEAETAERMIATTQKIAAEIGYDECCFNIEFFHNREKDRLEVVEMNSRLSQSHSHLFDMVDGRPHQHIAVALALDETPRWRCGEGRYPLAAKFFLRRVEDATVARVPDETDMKRLQSELPDVVVEVKVEPGQRLSDLIEQESYSYEIADIFVGGDDEADLERKYDRAVEILDFRFE